MSEWNVRHGSEDDRELLSLFQCADPDSRFEAEVELFIRDQLLDWALAPNAAGDDPRLLLLLLSDTNELIGVAAHERTTLVTGRGVAFDATKLEVAALNKQWQGRRFSTGERASDVLMSALMKDVVTRMPPRYARIFGVVHKDNRRSVGLCRRYGLTEEMTSRDPDYRRLVTPHQTDIPNL